jgi:hypothetical protein
LTLADDFNHARPLIPAGSDIAKKLGESMKRGVATYFAVLSLGCLADNFNPTTNQLFIDAVQVGDTVYSGVVITPGTVINLGRQSPTAGANGSNCAGGNFTGSAFSAIQLGMTLDQVSQLLRCNNDAGRTYRLSSSVTYVWSAPTPSEATVQVSFDATGAKVSAGADGEYKFATGF